MTPETKLRVLIVDDEPLARQRLEDLLAARDDVEIAGTADSGRKAVEAIRTLKPDLVFLDVQMPGLTGVEVVQEVGPEHMPAVIFVTAFDQYAVKAFELAALDYLLKPFDDERFEQAFERARRAVLLRDVETIRTRLARLFNPAPDPPRPPRPDYLERIAVDMRGQVRVIPVEEIECITASGTYAELHVGKDRYVIRERMQTLEERLDPARFMRIHRSAIVRLDLVETLFYNPGGDYAVRLKSGKKLSVSRSRRKELEARLGLDALKGE
ncbi:LytTR family DNA-binding domain-containing protein [Rhodocaloribacter litoris]|uniref:LytR/AlgR family response regulator transcription factor n=1 Tax=Rhodocaloribacter litoris TaxID=2558931 RepID=UPI00142386E9|nr:LytTR family DNA-binding domain-containing protein [Rhodocaloribacter litoris]QXD14678.1 LytTR family DNA-binding domain-containing protein [Rhodocaloribacter litoris]GIV59235.1 MAG: DNA-binding response regulator [Rhodothermaceae bacterium]